MKVILKQAVPKLGKEGQVVVVADGYARNFLFPRGMAIVAAKNQLAALDRRKARLATKLAENKDAAEAQREKIHGKTVRIEAKVGADAGKLFGAITNAQVTEAIKSAFGVEVDRKNVALVQPIKRLGVHDVRVDLHPEVDAHVSVEVYDPNAPVAPVEAPAAEAPAAEAEAEAEA